jgi:hypothetical protein
MEADICKSLTGNSRLLCEQLVEKVQTNPYAELWERSSAESTFVHATGRHLGTQRTYDGGRAFVGMLLSAVSHEGECEELRDNITNSVRNASPSEELELVDRLLELRKTYNEICDTPFYEFRSFWTNRGYREYWDKKKQELVNEIYKNMILADLRAQ